MLTKTLFAAAAALALGLAAEAQAAPPRPLPDPEIVSEKVSLADLDLNRQAGAAMALSRIRGAARRVCGGEPSRWAMNAVMLYRECRRDAADRAVARLDHPLVTALNARKPAGVIMAHR